MTVWELMEEFEEFPGHDVDPDSEEFHALQEALGFEPDEVQDLNDEVL
ncbi:MAG: hypothetical protein GXX09_08180 [Syntrophomonadaceae bacterium]|nr:hypothetical protein [Syntrophomonadaceae bacterium]